MIDVISPCVTFNDHDGSTKSYSYVKDHEEPLGEISFVPYFEDINVEYEPGSTTAVKLHDGSSLLLRKLADDYNPSDKMTAMRLLHETNRRGEFATGIIYIEPDKDDFIDTLNLVDQPLAFLPPEKVRPPKAVLDEIMEGLT
jgi:2-oxoglutarate ferredoxin oxidoreductase subunit beta